MANFGELVLVLGDVHIPERASKIPAPLKRMLVPNKMQHVICTGNISTEMYEELRTLAPNVHIVAGDFDTTEMVFPETRVVQVGAFRIGVVHGHQVLPWKNQDAAARMRRKLNVDILISGHTHQNEVTLLDESYYHINPGSITGAFSSLTEQVTPSFILLAVQDKKVVCYVYELVNGEVEVSKTDISKSEASQSSSANSSLMASLLT
ncbi:predicted protein [Phaeodactylum tricornutum CCAP 1055/1]|jgi:vacuolar protein sorting-associated protein 29|uniref:Vacuolar protein sorting-associated protein 29 n=2 Tax=Phaeodactylum tricornutum TaxID=2850 RepID=B7FR35_PHATC|nr:predicted protein [Phaeodactylum tricornutum CCAP 1055/1]EEC51438.1 predicted protein [Phaeodactylum tricornutum CCAP 1055/1]|eukprot:XP_002176975.1 predicted protein [Phaeodactylum tricornutum CCAP 1055/1]